MLVSAAVCPHPPALVPALSQGGARLLDALRSACVESVRALAAAQPDLLICVGAGRGTTQWGPDAGGTLAPFGSHTEYGGSRLVLPPALTVAAYLLEQAGLTADAFRAVAPDAPGPACAELGVTLAESGARVAMLVMGDGSAKRSTRSPGYLDPRAADFDRAVVAALGRPDPAALLGIEPWLADELWVAGRPSWQVLAGALTRSIATMRGTIRYDDAPLGVGYFVVQLEAA